MNEQNNGGIRQVTTYGENHLCAKVHRATEPPPLDEEKTLWEQRREWLGVLDALRGVGARLPISNEEIENLRARVQEWFTTNNKK